MLLTATVFIFTGCNDDASVASYNVSKAADNFEVDRRIIFYNGITGEYMLNIEGKCSIEPRTSKLSVTCLTGYNTFKKHYLGLSDNVTYFVEQLEPIKASKYHYRVTFKPQEIIPDIDFRGSTSAVINAVTPDSRD